MLEFEADKLSNETFVSNVYTSTNREWTATMHFTWFTKMDTVISMATVRLQHQNDIHLSSKYTLIFF